MAQAPAEDDLLSIEPALNHAGAPTCRLMWGERQGHLTPAEVRALALNWLEVADAAESDALVLGVLEDMRVSVDLRDAFMSALRERRPQI